MTTRTAVTTAPRLAEGVPELSALDFETLWKMYPPLEGGMPASIIHQSYYIYLITALTAWFDRYERDVGVFGDWFIYYLDQSGLRLSVGPDVAIVFDRDLRDADNYGSYFIELMGKPPEFILEIASSTTAMVDLREKPGIYAGMGVLEYWLFDPTGGDLYGLALSGMRLVNGEYEPIETRQSPNGGIRGHSEILGLDLLWENDNLRLIDPLTGERLLRPDEVEAEARSERRAREAAEARADTAEARAKAAEAELAELRRQMLGR